MTKEGFFCLLTYIQLRPTMAFIFLYVKKKLTFRSVHLMFLLL